MALTEVPLVHALMMRNWKLLSSEVWLTKPTVLAGNPTSGKCEPALIAPAEPKLES
jgi:hypothetical protein